MPMPGRTLSNESKIRLGYGVVDVSRPWEYKPWIQAEELCNGVGRRHIISDIYYPERRIHLMSDLELKVYYLLRKDLRVQELFEQVALNLQETQCICEEMNILHPKEPYTKDPFIMTTDFLAYVKTGDEYSYMAFAVKPSSQLSNKRVLEKLKVEQTYWQNRGIEWYIVTESIFNQSGFPEQKESKAYERNLT